jgi:hypothetical protein
MSVIPAKDPLNPILGLSSALPSGLGAAAAGEPSSERAKTFADIFQSAEEAALDLQREKGDLSDAGLAASVVDVARTQNRKELLSDSGLPGTVAGSRPHAGPVPGLSEAEDQPVPPVSMAVDGALSQEEEGAPSVPIKGYATAQFEESVADGMTPIEQRSAPHRFADQTTSASFAHPAGPVPGVSPEDVTQLDLGQRSLTGSETGGDAKQPAAWRADPFVSQPRIKAEPNLSAPPGMRPEGSNGGLSHALGQFEFDPEYALVTESKTGLPRELIYGPWGPYPAQTGSGYAPLPSLAMRSAGLNLLSGGEAAKANPFADVPELGLGDEVGMPAVTEVSDLRFAVSMGPNGQYQPLLSLARTDLPQAIAQQIAVAVESQGAGKSTIDLQLAPEELGRVRLRLTSHEGVVAVTVLAERPETLDLLRRHIETLARGLLDVGYQEARFAFSGQNPGGSPGKTLNAQGATHREDEGRGAVPDVFVPPALSSPALAGARINVLI